MAQVTETSRLPRDEARHNNAHEAAHFWWRIARAQDDWLNEALAEYGAWKDSVRREGMQVGRAWLRLYLDDLRSQKPTEGILGTTAQRKFRYVNWYERGALFFACSEGSVDAQKATRRLLEIGKTRQITADDLIGEYRRQGRSESWIRSWLDEPGLEKAEQCLAEKAQTSSLP